MMGFQQQTLSPDARCGAAIGISGTRDYPTMALNQASNEEQRSAETEKKPYEKPAFRYEQVFVTSALTCGKTITEGSCHLNTKVS
jgi:hypothetical protein